VVWHHSLLLMNSFNKTEAAVFSCRLCFLRAFPFISLIHVKPFLEPADGEGNGVVLVRNSGGRIIQYVGTDSNRSVCDSQEQEGSTVLFMDTSSAGLIR